jgi:ribosomal protein L20A (L18A)
VLYILESIFVFLFDLIANTLLFFYTPKSKLEKNIDKLRNEKWFSTLIDDYRYSYIICSNRKVKRILVKSENVELLMKNETEREKFINLVEMENRKFVGLK